MFNSKQSLHQPAMQNLTTFFSSELQTTCQFLQQENPQNPNLLGKSPASDPILFEYGSNSKPPKFTALDYDDPIEKYFSEGYLDDNWWTIEDPLFGFEGQAAFSLKDHALPVPGKAFQMLMAKKEPKSFLAFTKTGKDVRAKSLGLIDVTGLVPNDPVEKHAVCRALGFSSAFQVPGKYVLKLCEVTGNGGCLLLGDQSLDPTASYVVDFPVIKQLWLSAKGKSLTNLIDQAQADYAKKHGKEAEDEYRKMVEYCPREVLANFYSVELWDMLTLEDKVKEEIAKLPLCKSPEIIDPPPAAFINHPVPALDFKPSSSPAEGGVKFFLIPDLNEICVEHEAGESTLAFAIGEEEKANSKKRKAEAANGEGEDHVPKIPTFPAIP